LRPSCRQGQRFHLCFGLNIEPNRRSSFWTPIEVI
jgi:hypothetical protein